MSPEQEAWTAVIENAVRDVLDPKGQGATKEEELEAFEWLTSDDRTIGTFLWAANHLGMSEGTIDRIRNRVLDFETKLPRWK